MSLTHNQIVKLLAYLAAHDQRTVGEEDVLAWSDAADYGRWTLEEAQAAVRQLANTPRGHRVQPVDVTELLKAQRQDAAMRETVTERTAAREALEGSVARAIERGTNLGRPTHGAEHHVDAIYDQHGWSPIVRAAAKHKCPVEGCRADIGAPCTRPTARAAGGRIVRKEPHPARSALTVACPAVDCGADEGAPCAVGHPHHARDILAIGEAGQRRRRTHVAELRAKSAAPDWTREIDFVSPDPDHEPPPDPHELPAPRDAHEPSRADA